MPMPQALTAPLSIAVLGVGKIGRIQAWQRICRAELRSELFALAKHVLPLCVGLQNTKHFSHTRDFDSS